MQYAEKTFVRRTKRNEQHHSVEQQLWKGVCANDKKAVYRYIVSFEADMKSVAVQELKSMSLKSPKIRLSLKQENIEQQFHCSAGDSKKSSSSLLNSLYGNEDQLIEYNPKSCSLLHLACQTADVGMVELLLQYGANINVADSKGQTPLHYCIMRGNNAVAKMLLMRCVFVYPFDFIIVINLSSSFSQFGNGIFPIHSVSIW